MKVAGGNPVIDRIRDTDCQRLSEILPLPHYWPEQKLSEGTHHAQPNFQEQNDAVDDASGGPEPLIKSPAKETTYILSASRLGSGGVAAILISAKGVECYFEYWSFLKTNHLVEIPEALRTIASLSGR